VWEANHVWLVFVLVVFWTAYPTAFGSIASTLSIPLFLAGIGIVLRGASYALRSGIRTPRELRVVDTAFAISSLLVPFALGATVGGIASLRVPVGNAAGDLFTSWFNATGIMIGVIAVASAAYLSAVFLAADAVRAGETELEGAFRARALGAGVLAGGLAVIGLIVLHSDAHRLFHGLVHGAGLVALIVSVLAGVAALWLVLGRRYEPARYVAGVAVAAIVAGWALAQEPLLLRNLTIRQAAAPHDTLVLVVVAVLAGGAVLAPSLGLLFRLVLGGRLDHGAKVATETGAGPPAATTASAGGGPAAGSDSRRIVAASASGLAARGAVAAFVIGFGTLTLADAGWAHVIGVIAFFSFILLGFVAVSPAELAERS
jgi:cytochrome bd ubiquinol oxidase subunit II